MTRPQKKNEEEGETKMVEKREIQNEEVVFVKMQVDRITSSALQCKPGDCFKMPYGEARAYIARDQALLIDEKAYQAFLSKKAKEAQEKG